MSTKNHYRPIACSLHDQLEAAATMGRRVQITFCTPGGERRQVEERIRDIVTRDGAEYLVMESAEEIRLDRIEAFSEQS